MGIKVLIVGMLHKRADNGIFSKEGGPSNVLLTLCKSGKKTNWVAISVGTLVINEGRMLKGIHLKLLSFMCTDLRS
jgi:hypothetical protein